MLERFSLISQKDKLVSFPTYPQKMLRVLIFFVIAKVVLSAHLPPDIKPCKVSDANFKECLKSTAQTAFAKLSNGNKELGIPPLDPLRMGSLTIEKQTGPISILQKYDDLVINGLTRVTVQAFSVNLKDCLVHVELLAPSLQVKGKYDLKGQLMVFPIDAQGEVVANFKNLVVQSNATCEMFKNNGLEHFRMTSTKVIFVPSEVQFQLGNLIKGNEELDKQVHKVIEDDPLAFFQVIRPGAEELWVILLKEILNDVFTKIPKNELFKD